MDITVTLTQAQIDLIEPLLPVDENNVTQSIEDYVHNAAIQALASHAFGGANVWQAQADAFNAAVAPINAAFGSNFTWA